MKKEWFEMNDLKKHSYDNKVWIPIYANKKLSESGELGFEGFTEEYIKVRSFIAPKKNKEAALKSDTLNLEYEDKTVKGYSIVLEQFFSIEGRSEVLIHQDIILDLGLKRDGDFWVCPEEDYAEVIKIERDDDGNPVYVEIKAEYLKDFLCAKKSGLVLKSYRSRKAIREKFDDIDWTKDKSVFEENDKYKWEGRLAERSEGNSLLDILGGAIVSVAGRTDVDFTEDIPVYEFPTDANTRSETYSVKPTGRKLLQASGELRKTEWIEPANKSPRVKGDEIPSNLEFIVDNSGKTETSKTLGSSSRWLWFHPNVVNELLKKRTGFLTWQTEDTGEVGGAWNRSIHFGVNSLGLVNVYAEDIADVNELDKKIWASNNVAPEGRISDELHSIQMQTLMPETEAPEQTFFSLVSEIEKIFNLKTGQKLFREHAIEEIAKKIHRFHVITLEDFYSLCKEITRFLIERINRDSLKAVKKEDNKLGELKRLENILSALGYDGRKIMGVLAGVYDLRLADAHLPSDEKTEVAMKLVAVDFTTMKLNSGKELIKNINASLTKIKEAFENGDFSKIDK